MSRAQHLRSLLEALAPADSREAEHRERMLRLVAEDGDPFAREQFEPGHITASAFILNPQRTALLLILHGKLGLWLQPGGHVDPSDADVIAAAAREVREEVALDPIELITPGIFDVDVHAIPARPGQPAHEHFDARFLFAASNDRAIAGSDARDARWFALTELSASPLPSDESVMRAARKLARWSR
jgi:8-oxo-dGTP pyrophosphatase MutT (NUDIX family)